MCMRTNYKVEICRLELEPAQDRQTHTLTHRRDWKYYHAALASGNDQALNPWSISEQRSQNNMHVTSEEIRIK